MFLDCPMQERTESQDGKLDLMFPDLLTSLDFRHVLLLDPRTDNFIFKGYSTLFLCFYKEFSHKHL